MQNNKDNILTALHIVIALCKHYLSKPQDLLSAPARPGFIQIPAVLASLHIQPFASPSGWLDMTVTFCHLH